MGESVEIQPDNFLKWCILKWIRPRVSAKWKASIKLWSDKEHHFLGDNGPMIDKRYAWRITDRMAYSKTAYWRSTWTVIDWIILTSMRWLSNFNEHIGVNSVNYFVLNYTVIVKWVRPAGLIKHTFHVSHRSAYPSIFIIL